jgi:hypothetical protein
MTQVRVAVVVVAVEQMELVVVVAVAVVVWAEPEADSTKTAAGHLVAADVAVASGQIPARFFLPNPASMMLAEELLGGADTSAAAPVDIAAAAAALVDGMKIHYQKTVEIRRGAASGELLPLAMHCGRDALTTHDHALVQSLSEKLRGGHLGRAEVADCLDPMNLRFVDDHDRVAFAEPERELAGAAAVASAAERPAFAVGALSRV